MIYFEEVLWRTVEGEKQQKKYHTNSYREEIIFRENNPMTHLLFELPGERICFTIGKEHPIENEARKQSMVEERRRIEFHGRVQGVGFRYQARRYAAALGLKGWIRNEYDGSVCMEVQGNPAFIDQLLKNLNSDRYISIDWMDSRTIPLGADDGFHVRY